jgi:hypothetical protein
VLSTTPHPGTTRTPAPQHQLNLEPTPACNRWQAAGDRRHSGTTRTPAPPALGRSIVDPQAL